MHVTVIVKRRQLDRFATIAAAVYQRDARGVSCAVSGREWIGMVLCLPDNRVSQALHSYLVLVSRAWKIDAVELRVGAGLEIKTEVGGPAPGCLRADGTMRNWSTR